MADMQTTVRSGNIKNLHKVSARGQRHIRDPWGSCAPAPRRRTARGPLPISITGRGALAVKFSSGGGGAGRFN